MPMDPMDAMWMTRPPTVADAFGSSNVVFKSALKNNNNNNERKMTIAAGETPKLTQEPSSPVAIPRTRHFSISETFGSPFMNAFQQWAASPRQRSISVCEENLKDIVAKKTDN